MPDFSPSARRCGAHTKRGNEPCRNPAVTGSPRCRLHGGKSPRGAAHPSFTHGRRSRFVPAGLAERYRSLATDTELLDLAHEVAITSLAMDDELHAAVESGAQAALWREAQDRIGDLRTAIRGADVQAVIAAQRALESVLLQGQAGVDAWDRWHALAAGKAKLVTAETRRRVSLGKSLAPAEVAAISAMQLDAIRVIFEQYSVPRAAYAELAERFGRLLSTPLPGEA